MNVRMTKDVLAGGIFIMIGLGGALIATGYSFGSPTRMGPGFFPILVGSAVAILGVALIVSSLLKAGPPETVDVWEVRPFLFVLAGVIAFMLTIDRFGLLVAVPILTILASFARKEFRIVETVVMCVTFCVVGYVIFAYGLRIPLKVINF